MIRFILATTVSLFFVGFAAQAQEPSASAPVGETTPEIVANSPCAKDVQTYCASVEPGGGNIAKCLRDNQAKLSTECKMARDKMKIAFKEVKAACHDDYEKFCETVKPGGGRIMKCMKEHKDQLSSTCKDEIEKKKSEYGKKKK